MVLNLGGVYGILNMLGKIKFMRIFEKLKKYSEGIVDRFPEDAETLDLCSPIISSEELDSLCSLKVLPGSYIDVASQIALLGKEIGYFQLSPVPEKTLFDSITSSYSKKNPYFSKFELINAVQVASFEAEPIGVIKRDYENEGEVFILNILEPSMAACKIANSFQDFILFACKLDTIRECHEGPNAVGEFIEFLQDEFPDTSQDAWQEIAEIVLL